MYGRLFRKELQGLVQGTGTTRSTCIVVCFDEVTTAKAFSARALKQLLVVENEAAEPRFPSPDEAAVVLDASADGQPNDDDLELLHHADREDGNNYSTDVVSCHGVKWKVIEGVFEDWRCSPQYGAHILWGNDADGQHRTPLDYWKLSFLTAVA